MPLIHIQVTEAEKAAWREIAATTQPRLEGHTGSTYGQHGNVSALVRWLLAQVSAGAILVQPDQAMSDEVALIGEALDVTPPEAIRWAVQAAQSPAEEITLGRQRLAADLLTTAAGLAEVAQGMVDDQLYPDAHMAASKLRDGAKHLIG